MVRNMRWLWAIRCTRLPGMRLNWTSSPARRRQLKVRSKATPSKFKASRRQPGSSEDLMHHRHGAHDKPESAAKPKPAEPGYPQHPEQRVLARTQPEHLRMARTRGMTSTRVTA